MDKYLKYLNYINDLEINYEIRYEIKKKSKNDINLKKVIGGRFISKEIMKEILEKDVLDYSEFIYKINRFNITGSLIIGYYKNDNINNINNYKVKLEILSKILIFLALISKKKENLYAYIFLTKYKKISNGSQFNPENINSGYTTFSMLDKYIVVYRNEEFIKVMIHEAIHYYELDTHFRQFGVLNSYLPFKFKSDDIVTEAFTDYYAIWYYNIYLTLMQSNISLENKKDIFNNFFYLQLDFIKNQAIKIIQLSQVNQTNIINNNTNVFSYYILKYILLEYYRNVNLLKLNKENFTKIINKMIHFIKNVKNKPHTKNSSLTMTINH
jgi:hypothetical protein